jgi:hypothetical protein
MFTGNAEIISSLPTFKDQSKKCEELSGMGIG